MNLSEIPVVSIFGLLFGIGMTIFNEKRLRKSKREAAKEEILGTLALSLGEHNTPTYEIIKSTIRSVVRKTKKYEIGYIQVSEIVDDLIAGVLSANFLDAERRKSLQNELLRVTKEPNISGDENSRPSLLVDEDVVEAEKYQSERYLLRYVSPISIILGLFTTLLTLAIYHSGLLDAAMKYVDRWI